MTLHLDILLYICDILAQDSDIESLKSCALVCSQLAVVCQSHLFACVTLLVDSRDRSPKTYQLQKVLKANPKLGTYIKDLRISFSRSSYWPYPTDPAVAPILSYCTNVTSFKVKAVLSHRQYRGMWPKAVPRDTSAALESIIYSPALARLKIGGFKFPSLAEFFSHCSSALTELHLLERSFEENQQLQARGIKGEPIFLRKLSLKARSSELLSFLLEAEREDGRLVFDFSQLQDLSTSCNSASVTQSINTLLFRCAAPLRTLEIEFTCKLTLLRFTVSLTPIT